MRVDSAASAAGRQTTSPLVMRQSRRATVGRERLPAAPYAGTTVIVPCIP